MKFNTAAPNVENYTTDQYFAEPHDGTVVENHTVAQNVETGFKCFQKVLHSWSYSCNPIIMGTWGVLYVPCLYLKYK